MNGLWMEKYIELWKILHNDIEVKIFTKYEKLWKVLREVPRVYGNISIYLYGDFGFSIMKIGLWMDEIHNFHKVFSTLSTYHGITTLSLQI